MLMLYAMGLGPPLTHCRQGIPPPAVLIGICMDSPLPRIPGQLLHSPAADHVTSWVIIGGIHHLMLLTLDIAVE